ncbi:MAG: 3'(2'),5'-bisphosphate nucleotidase [Chloroflexota bacterium]
MINLKSTQLGFALKAVRQATLLVKKIQAEMVTEALTKGDKSPVTVADFAAQAVVARLLLSTYPDTPLVGEESAAALTTPEEAETLDQITAFVSHQIRDVKKEQVAEWINYGSTEPTSDYWTLDPIDGTKGFLRGQQYAVAFGLVVNGKVELGVLGCPNLTDGQTEEIGGPGSLIIAQRGQGTWTTPLTGQLDLKQLHVSEISSPAEARFLRSYESGHTNVSQLDVIGEKMGVAAEPVRLDSQAKYSILAAGAGDALFRLISAKMPDYKEKVWDQAAGSIVCEEAGGKVTDLDGKPLDFSQGRTLAHNRGILATNGKLHDAILEAIKAVGA